MILKVTGRMLDVLGRIKRLYFDISLDEILRSIRRHQIIEDNMGEGDILSKQINGCNMNFMFSPMWFNGS